VSDGSTSSARLRERLTTDTEDKLGKALADLLENPLVTGAIGKAFDARERKAQAQELALGVLNLPTAADVERLTRRLRSVSQRLEGIEDGVQRINRVLSESVVERRLEAIEERVKAIGAKLAADGAAEPAKRPAAGPAKGSAAAPTPAPRSAGARTTPRASSASGKPRAPSRGSSRAASAKKPRG
jgi:hypothetical protein